MRLARLRLDSPSIGESLTPRLTRAQRDEHMPGAGATAGAERRLGVTDLARELAQLFGPADRTEGETRSRAPDRCRGANRLPPSLSPSLSTSRSPSVSPSGGPVSGSTHKPAARARRSAAAACFFCCFSSRRSRTACSRVRFAAVCCRLDLELIQPSSLSGNWRSRTDREGADAQSILVRSNDSTCGSGGRLGLGLVVLYVARP